uniref:Zgc:158868 n=1 Tax=Oryzias latipes TaxID=8090 RepID=A0A3P9IKL1_ORYLA
MSVALGGNILVTGTSRGIGLELVRQLAEKTGGGAHIYACCRDPVGAGGQMFLPLLQRAAKSCLGDKDGGMSCRRSAVINVSTLLSSIEKCPETFAMAPMYPYRISKAALNMLTCCQAENFRADDILVAAVHPGWVRTHMGGEEAPLTTEDSVLGIIRVLSTLSSKHSGRLLDWEGNSIPW